jgi:phage protein D
LDLKQLEQTYKNFYAPGFTIAVSGTDLQKAGAQITAVSVDNDLAGADQFSFTINNPYDPSSGSFAWLDNGIIDNEKEVLIRMGYADAMEDMILGMISSVKASFASGGGSQLQVSGYDLSYKLMKGKNSNSWNNKKDSDVVQLIAGNYGFNSVNADDTKVVFPQIKQDKQSDFEFIKQLADRNGFEFSVADRDVSFIAPPKNSGLSVVATLHWGKTLSSFAPEVTTTDQVSEVKVIGWDPASKKEIIGSAKPTQPVPGNASVEEVRKPVYSKAEADTLAAAILDEIMRGRVKGSGECLGIPVLKPGCGIELQGLGARFSKVYYLEKTTHTIGTSGYKTSFGAREADL